MVTESGFLRDPQQFAFSHEDAGQPFCVYADPAYPLRVHLQCPFRHWVLTDEMKAYNASMSAVRSSVEWLFGDIINYFKSLDFKKNLQIGLSSVGKMYNSDEVTGELVIDQFKPSDQATCTRIARNMYKDEVKTSTKIGTMLIQLPLSSFKSLGKPAILLLGLRLILP